MEFDKTIRLTDLISIAAILISPLIALYLTRYFEEKQKNFERRYNIFKTLLTTRSNTLSIHHVEALNSIDAEFNEKEFKGVLDKWQLYLQHLNQKPQSTGWSDKCNDLLVDLIFEIGKSLKIDFEKSRINQNAYYPSGHFEIENEVTEIRKAILEFLRKDRSLKIEFSKDAENGNDPLG
jgi:hypothetical protein